MMRSQTGPPESCRRQKECGNGSGQGHPCTLQRALKSMAVNQKKSVSSACGGRWWAMSGICWPCLAMSGLGWPACFELRTPVLPRGSAQNPIKSTSPDSLEHQLSSNPM
eukprot:1158493-Pelagomonas_calceolata.AAC.5